MFGSNPHPSLKSGHEPSSDCSVGPGRSVRFRPLGLPCWLSARLRAALCSYEGDCQRGGQRRLHRRRAVQRRDTHLQRGHRPVRGRVRHRRRLLGGGSDLQHHDGAVRRLHGEQPVPGRCSHLSAQRRVHHRMFERARMPRCGAHLRPRDGSVSGVHQQWPVPVRHAGLSAQRSVHGGLRLQCRVPHCGTGL